MALTEILIPAGDLEKLQTAVRFGADAVYVGAGQYSLRSAGQTAFNLSDLKKGDLSSCFERIEMNKPIIDSYHLLTFNEFWTICHLCEKPIPLTDFYKQKSLRQLYRMKTDSLAIILFSFILYE